LTAELLRRTQTDLGTRAGSVQLVAVNTEYRFVAPADALAWSRQHSMTHRWEFLTGTFVDLQRVWRAYGIVGGSAHTTAVFVIDPQGLIRTVLPMAMASSIGTEATTLTRFVTGLGA
jgi:alkyl hydroperoxide reductase subunit AhpC